MKQFLTAIYEWEDVSDAVWGASSHGAGTHHVRVSRVIENFDVVQADVQKPAQCKGEA